MARKGNAKIIYKILVGNAAGWRPLWRPECRFECNWKEGLEWSYVAVFGDTWRADVCMVMKLGHLSNCNLLDRNSAPRSYENRCRTWRHTQHVPEHVEALQGRTERLQQCLLVSKQDSFSEILQGAFRSPPILDWDSATRKFWMQYWIVYVRSLARTESLVVLTVTRILDSFLTSSRRNPSVRAVTACFVAQYMP